MSRSRTHGPQPLAHRPQQLVARVVAEAVVDDLEVVEVDEQHGDRPGLGDLQVTAELGRGTGTGWADGSARRGSPPTRSRSALWRCSVMSSMWAIASALPSPSSITDTHVRAHTTLAVVAHVPLLHAVRVGASIAGARQQSRVALPVVGMGDRPRMARPISSSRVQPSMVASDSLTSISTPLVARSTAPCPSGAPWNASAEPLRARSRSCASRSRR